MNRSISAEYSKQREREKLAGEVLDIIEAEDGRNLQDKIKSVMAYLDQIIREEPETTEETDVDCRTAKEAFWQFGEIRCADSTIILRPVEDKDREEYLGLQQEYSITKSMLRDESYRSILWNEHSGNKPLFLTITKDGNYIGYCGIHNTTRELWEIAIELKREWVNKGIGSIVLPAMLDAMKARLGVFEYRVRIDPGNQASQKLFEKMGALPNGISALFLHDPQAIEECEKENMSRIDDDLISLAERFSVEPRKLLSHVLEYKLVWSGRKNDYA